MKEKFIQQLDEKISKYGYVKFTLAEVENYLNIIKERQDILIFYSSYKTIWIVKGNNKYPTNTIDLFQEIYIPGIDPSIIDSKRMFEENSDNLLHSLRILEHYLKTNYLLIDINYNFRNLLFKYKYQNTSVEFTINDLPKKHGKIIETGDILYIVERDGAPVSDLIYKWLYLEKKTNKPVKILLMKQIRSNFEIREYRFDGEGIILINSKGYSLNNFKLSKMKIIAELKNFPIHRSFEVFPQADNIDLIFSIFEELENKIYKRNEIAKIIDRLTNGLVDRQISYYISALLYLDILLEVEPSNYRLSITANKEKGKSLNEKIEFLVSSILKHQVFNIVFNRYIETGEIPKNKFIAKIIHEVYPLNLMESTALRRSNTVRSWINWIIENLY